MAAQGKKVRLQIPVDEALAQRINELAETLDRSSSWTTGELLTAALITRDTVVEWLGLRILAAMEEAITGRKKKQTTGETIIIQTFLPVDTSKRLDVLANQLKNSPARTAAMLLEEGIRDNGWIIEWIAGPAARAKKKLSGGKAGSAGRTRKSMKYSPRM